ncbi:MAG: T9SS type A sorting domain-containing protein [Saprospiraceae bacterium]|nr:T9SS type A sorting domain-containing protein [Saprospiraceae bacterium]
MYKYFIAQISFLDMPSLPKAILTIIILFLFQEIDAATFKVGPTKTYTSPNALYLANTISDGDTIEIDAGVYSGQATLANWSRNNLLIRGIGGKAHLQANGAYIAGKSIWITSGNNITIENIEFSGAKVPDKNGAGIRSEGIDLTIRHCYFHHNENGILTNSPNAGHILIEYSEFAYNGFGDGFSHNLYINHVDKLTFRYNYSHHAIIGHNLKSRANENHILYNRIMDEATGNSSRLIDLSNGGLSIIISNLLMQGPQAENNNLVGYGLEGLSNSPSELYFVNNTLVNKRTASCIFLQIKTGTAVAQVINNIFAGTGTIIQGTTTQLSNNLERNNPTDLFFEDETGYDYRLKAESPAIDKGIEPGFVQSTNLSPEFVYLHPLNKVLRISEGSIDIGAYEYNQASATYQSYQNDFFFYPNPCTDLIYFNKLSSLSQIQIFNLNGKLISQTLPQSNQLSTSFLENGVYIIRFIDLKFRSTSFKLIKQ